jgi:membrane protease YdiL (CAAX protease family)
MIQYPEPDVSLMSGPVSIAIASLVLLIHHFTVSSGRFGNYLKNHFDPPAYYIRNILCARLLGAILFGLIPFMIIMLLFRRPLGTYGLAGDHITKSLLWWIPFAVVGVVLNYFTARSKRNLEMYPQIRVERWDRGLLIMSALSWITYLAGYEILFRGFLLFSCLESFGYWPAIIINTSIYSLFHIFKGFRETLGSVFFGFMLCYLTLHLGSIWFALFVHISVALSNEWFSLRFQPDMKLVKNQDKK